MSIRVECYAGFRAEQEPIAFWLGERKITVRAILDRWFAPSQRWFRVDADDGHVYVLRHDELGEQWDVAAFTRGGASESSSMQIGKTTARGKALS